MPNSGGDAAAAESASAVAIRELSRLTGVDAAGLAANRPAAIQVRESDVAITRERAIATESFTVNTPIISNCRTTAVP